jgi:anti-anti-sigma factor
VDVASDGDGITITVMHVSRDIVVTVTGDLDMASESRFESSLALIGGHVRVFVDLSSVEFMDSTGTRTLITHAQRLGNGGGVLWVREPSEAVRQALFLSGLSFLIER